MTKKIFVWLALGAMLMGATAAELLDELGRNPTIQMSKIN